MVFFITILSLILQGTTVDRMAQWLGLKERLKEKEFKFELPDEITASMQEMEVTARLLSNGEMLKDVTLPPNTLVIMIKRDGKYLVPTGNTHLYLTDKLLLISEEAKHLQSLIESF
jgi:cell volume regulation protein A